MKTPTLYNVFVGTSLLIPAVTVSTSKDGITTLKGIGKRSWFERQYPKAAITRKVKVSG